MRALVLHGPGCYGYEGNWSMPLLKPGWALIRVAYCGICGSDIPRFAKNGSYHHPMILGHEFSGTVELVSDNGGSYKKGDPVSINPIIPCGECTGCLRYGAFHCERYQYIGSRNDGGMAEFCLVPLKNLILLSDASLLKVGAFIEPISVTQHVVRQSSFQPGKTAIVFGAGSIGILTAQWLKIFGAQRVLIADIRDENLEIARACGVSETVNPLKNQIAGSFDFAFEAAGAAKAIQNAVSILEPKGILTIVGRDTSDTIIPVKTFEKMMRQELIVKTCWGFDMANGSEMDFLLREMQKGSFCVEPMITMESSLAEAPLVIDQMINKKISYCKVLLDCMKQV